MTDHDDAGYVSDGDCLENGYFNSINVLRLEAGENVTAGNIFYIKMSDGEAYVSDTGTADDIRANGFVLTTATAGNNTDVQTSGIYTTSGLTKGTKYYLGAAGALSATASGVYMGVAVSTTQLLIDIKQDDKDKVGTIKMYQVSQTGLPSNNVTAFWVGANGQTISDAESPLNGEAVDDLNGYTGTQKFIRGGGAADGSTPVASGATGGSETHSHTIADQGDGDTSQGQVRANLTTAASSTLPSYTSTAFLIKIK